eukprot:UN03769
MDMSEKNLYSVAMVSILLVHVNLWFYICATFDSVAIVLMIMINIFKNILPFLITILIQLCGFRFRFT